jgi:hypothetical protein
MSVSSTPADIISEIARQDNAKSSNDDAFLVSGLRG